jgi:hypothetical protein
MMRSSPYLRVGNDAERGGWHHKGFALGEGLLPIVLTLGELLADCVLLHS